MDQKNPDLYNTRAVLHFENDDMENAMDDLMTAVKVDPEYPTGYKNLATVLFQTGNFDEAYENYLTAVKLENPKFRPPSTVLNPVVTTTANVLDQVKLTKHKQYRILSVDGGQNNNKYILIYVGGVRALIPALILKEIEQKVKRPICELFDFLAGTSRYFGSFISSIM